MSKASISIVTCSYQQGRFIDATMRSVLDQKTPGLEYIVIDGGSHDGSVDVIKRHAHQLAYWVSEKDRGQTHALSKGFARATGDIQGWLCSDDLLLPGSLDFVIDFFRRHPEVDFMYGDALWIDGQGRYLRPKAEMRWAPLAFLHDHNFLAQPSCFWRQGLLERVGGLNEDLHLTMDSDLWLRFSQVTRPVHVPRFLSCMRFYPEQKTRAMAKEGVLESARLKTLFRYPWQVMPEAILKPVARLERWALKLTDGGYTRQPPTELVHCLERYHVD